MKESERGLQQKVDDTMKHVVVSVRRSSRRRLHVATEKESGSRAQLQQWRFSSLSGPWRQQYLDLGHCRLQKCITRLLTASTEDRQRLRNSGLSFTAMAISAAASSGRSSSSLSSLSREQLLAGYVTAVIDDGGLEVNDSYKGDSSIILAAYHGFSQVVQLLLDQGCSLDRNNNKYSIRNAIFASIRNGQHDCLQLMLSRRSTESINRVIQSESQGYEERGLYHSSLKEAITKRDLRSLHLLMEHNCAFLSDLDGKRIYLNKTASRHMEKVLEEVYPSLSNVRAWRGLLHWSFPQTDRETLNWLWHATCRQRQCTTTVAVGSHVRSSTLPDVIWKRVFGYIGRGWFACRVYKDIGRNAM